MRRNRRIRAGAFALAHAALIVPAARAVTVYWDRNSSTTGAASVGALASGTWDNSGGANNNWTTDINGESATTNYSTANGGSPTTADVVFSAGTLPNGANLATGVSLISTSGSGVQANSVSIRTGAVSLSGSTISLGSGGLNLASTALGNSTIQTVNLVSSQQWTNSSSYALNISNAITSPGATNTLTLSSSGLGGYVVTGMTNGTSGSFNLVVNSTLGRTVINSTNSLWTGNALLSSGILVSNSSSALGTTASQTLTFSGGTLQYGVFTDYSARFSTAAGQQFKIDTNNSSGTYAGNISSTGGSFTKLGRGSLTLNGTNTFDGGITVGGGVLVLNSAGALGSTGTISFANGGLLRFGVNNTTDYTSRFSTAAGQDIRLDPNAATITVGDLNGSSSTLSIVSYSKPNDSPSTAGVANVTGNLGAAFGGVYLNYYDTLNNGGQGMTVSLSGSNNQYSGGTNVQGGTLVVNAASTLGANSAGNGVTVAGAGLMVLTAATNIGGNQTITLGDALGAFVSPGLNGFVGPNNGAVAMLDLRFGTIPTRVSSANTPTVIGITSTTLASVTLTNQEYLGSRGTGTVSGAISLASSANNVYRLGAGGVSGAVNPTLVVISSLTDAPDTTSRSLIVGVTPFLERTSVLNGTGTLALRNSATYSGTTLINVGSTLNLGGVGTGTIGSILNSSGVMVKGNLTIDNTTGGTTSTNRIGDNTPVTLQAGTLNLNAAGSGTGTYLEDVGDLVLDGRSSTITLASAASKASALQADQLVRNNNATLILQSGAAFGSGSNNVSRLVLDTISNLGFIGSSTTAGATNLKVAPWIMSSNGTGAIQYTTYDSTAGTLRPLTLAETTTLAASALDSSADLNVFSTLTANQGLTSGTTMNSLALATSAASGTTFSLSGAGLALSISSGGLAQVTTSRAIELTNFGSITLGNDSNPEGVVYVDGAGSLTVSTPINSGKAYGLTKAGNGTLILNTANTFTGALVVNGGAVDLRGSNTFGAATLNGGILRLNAANALGSSNLVVNAGGSLRIGSSLGAGPTTLGSGTVLLNDGAMIGTGGSTDGNGNNPVVDLGAVRVAGTVRMYVNPGTGSRSVTFNNNFSLDNGAVVGYRNDNNSITTILNSVTLNGTGTFYVAPPPGATGNVFRMVTIGQGTLGAGNLVLGGSTPAGTTATTVEITGSSTYTGTTTLKGGMVRVTTTGRLGSGNVSLDADTILQLDNSSALADSSSLTLASGATVNLNFTGFEVVNSLVLGGATYTTGVFNAGTNSDYFTGSGSIAVPEPASISLLAMAGGLLLKRRRRA